MRSRLGRLCWLALVILLAGCRSEPTPTPVAVETPTSAPAEPAPVPVSVGLEAPVESDGRLVISEVLLAAPGNNNLEFIEFYNAGTRPVELEGWSLWYRLRSGREEKLLYRWAEPRQVPGFGHYLLARLGQKISPAADALFDSALFETMGGLQLRDESGRVVESLGWGDAPAGFYEGSPAPAPPPGTSLERLPGGSEGNGVDTANNAADFVTNPSPEAQNTGSDITPLPGGRLVVALVVPPTVEPGSRTELVIAVSNLTGQTVGDVLVSIPLPEGFQVLEEPVGVTVEGNRASWTIAELGADAVERAAFVLSSPWTYVRRDLAGAHAETADWPLRAYSGPATITVAGGAIPIATARSLVGETVTIEGVATMYSDAYYAGSTGTKFYLEDESGGIQVYCPGGLGLVHAALGDRMRVTGTIEVYRGSMEIIPNTYPDDVELLEPAGPEWPSFETTLRAASSDADLLGRLITVRGTATRIEEFSYSYEIDLIDEQGFSLLVYIEIETGISVEPLETGRSYQVTGISEIYDTEWQLKPRLQRDLAEIFPPELMLDLSAENSVEAGGRVTVTLTVANHTESALNGVQLIAGQPASGAAIDQVLDGGSWDGNNVVWTVDELATGGGSATLRYLLRVSPEATGSITIPAASASADQWPIPATTEPRLTFIGSGVPIWAIQGPGSSSPYVRSQATTEGTVIGVFPQLEGFWIQETTSDDDPATSAGLFVLTGAIDPVGQLDLDLGDAVRVSGQVREKSGQSLLHLAAPEDLTVLSRGGQLPLAVELDPPRELDAAAAYYEALEGMLVMLEQPAVAVAPTTKYGETALVHSRWGIDRVWLGDPTGLLIVIDDGSAITHYDSTSLAWAVQAGDTVRGVAGPLAYTYDQFKIEPITDPIITRQERPLPVLEPTGPYALSVATWNAENLFDFQDPHPSDPPRPSLAEYRLRLVKTADTIARLGFPTIVGLQEVENLDILEDLVEQEALVGYDYQPALIEGTDSRGIDVGFLVRGDQATLVGVAAYPAPEGLTSRPPLLITATVHLASGDRTVYVLNNHFTSMSGGEAATEPRRTAQSEWNLVLVNRIQLRQPDALIVVLGDLNSFYDSPPIDLLRSDGLNHVYEFVAPEIPYTYIYQGESETLDHILVTPALYEHLAWVGALHVNADYPPPDPDDLSAQSSSDHDPLVAIFDFGD